MSHANGHTEPSHRRFVIRVFRYTAGESETPRFDTFEIDATPSTTVLTALFDIQQKQDSTLAFRFSCRGAVCGSCGITINGQCGLACRTQLFSIPSDEVILEPLPNLDVLRDLVVDMEPFWKKYESIRPWLHGNGEACGCHEAGSCTVPGEGGADEVAVSKEMLQSPREFARVEQYTNCILCACCYGTCPVLKRQPDYLGPAAMAKLLRFVDDSRDHRPLEQVAEVDHGDGVWGCDTVFRCIDACPKDVRPTDGISGLRRRLVSYRVRSVLGRKRSDVKNVEPKA